MTLNRHYTLFVEIWSSFPRSQLPRIDCS